MYKSETDTQELKVTFLDDFKITYKDKELSQKSINSDKVTDFWHILYVIRKML